MLTRKSSGFPLNLPISGGSLMNSTMWSRTRAQNCLGGIQTTPWRQTTFADLLVVLGKAESSPENTLMGILENEAKLRKFLNWDERTATK